MNKPRSISRGRGLVVSLLVFYMGGTAMAGSLDFQKYFQDKDGCFVLYDLKAGNVVAKFNEKRCAERFVPCSTFKVPLALMAFDKGVLKDENTTFKWDGKMRVIPEWNRDQTAASWMKYSVVWFSQQITPQLGMNVVEDYLKKFDYGTQDMSSGLTTAWLTSSSNPSLKISADEQVRFLARLWSGTLPVSAHASEMTKRITLLETSPRGAILHGKTGSSIPKDTLMGWFIGHLGNGDREYVFALNFTGPTPQTDVKMGGITAKELTKQILTDMELF